MNVWLCKGHWCACSWDGSGAGVEGKTAVGYAGDSPCQQVFVFNSSFSGFYVSGLNFRAGFKMSYNNQLPDGINCIFFYNIFNL